MPIPNIQSGANALTANDDSHKPKPDEQVRAPKIVYSVTIVNPSAHNVSVRVEYSDSRDHLDIVSATLAPGQTRYFGKKDKSMGSWTSSLVIAAIEIECEGHVSRLTARDFGVGTTTDHLRYTIVGVGSYTDQPKPTPTATPTPTSTAPSTIPAPTVRFGLVRG